MSHRNFLVSVSTQDPLRDWISRIRRLNLVTVSTKGKPKLFNRWLKNYVFLIPFNRNSMVMCALNSS